MIDLLNKIANGEEVPRKVEYKTLCEIYHWEYSEINKDYKDVNIVFGYKLINGSWNMIPYNELSSYVSNLNLEDDVIIYMIDLVEDNGLLEKYHVAGVSIEYHG